ncbi:MAG: metallophosphoesterase family protein [Spirochaetales bacterium]|nr:metallophosphoesterase family protein [Spirochaetales bacterium]
MKILCVSDTTISLAFSSNVSEIYKGTDVILSCGDMQVQNYDYLSTMLRRDVYYVFGNHNLETFKQTMDKDVMNFSKLDNEYNKKFYGFILDGKCMRDKRTGLLIAGLGGSMRYNNGDSQYTEAQMRRRIRRLALSLMRNKRKYGRYLDILVTHAPPFGVGDGPDLCHRGFKCFLDFIDKYQPKYLLHGHIHLDDQNANRITQHGATTVINVYGSYMLDTDESGEN